jgi:hypothetical protein
MARLALNLFSILAGAPVSRTTIEQHFAKAIDSMAEAFRGSPCSPSLLGPRYWQCTLEQKMTANLDKWPAFHSTGEDHLPLPLFCFPMSLGQMSRQGPPPIRQQL